MTIDHSVELSLDPDEPPLPLFELITVVLQLVSYVLLTVGSQKSDLIILLGGLLCKLCFDIDDPPLKLFIGKLCALVLLHDVLALVDTPNSTAL